MEKRHRDDGCVKRQAEDGVKQLKAKECLGLLGGTRSWKSLQGECGPLTPCFQPFYLQNVSE